jgi:hypothetical protein
MKVTEHVSYAEATQTNSNLANIPSGEQMERIKLLCEKVFEPLRKHVGKPIKINSIFRSAAVNKAIGGSSTSQHCANNGAAMDIDDTHGAMSNNDMGIWIMTNLDFDQLIFEKPVGKKSSWIHVSYKKTGNRKQVLIFDGKSYLPFGTHKHLIGL